MEPLQKQVITLSHKVDALYQVINDLSARVSEALSECRLAPTQETHNFQGVNAAGQYSTQSYSTTAMAHKDVLVDGTNLDNHHQGTEKELPPEIQIQRLTAQLTAAYNRIAALEELLLAKRIH